MNFCTTVALVFLALPGFSQIDSSVADRDWEGTLSQRWELEKKYQKGNLTITPYKPFYILPARWSSNPNNYPRVEDPRSPRPTRIPYNNYEAKINLSLKTKLWQNIFNTHSDLWVSYTQRSHWQIFNEAISRPFRETNYEPELIYNLRTDYRIGGFTGRMVGVTFNHQSNGQREPISRSWNRIIFHAGFERKYWSVLLKPWIRLKDDPDENPRIDDFIGRMEALVMYTKGRSQVYITGRHSLRTGDNNHGSFQVDWSYRVLGNLKLMAQFFEGYGETMLDYNHRQTCLGIGVMLVN